MLYHFKICISDRCNKKYVAKFGVIPFRASSNSGAEIAAVPPTQLIQRGWLIHETLVQLKLHGSSALQIWKQKHRNKDFYIKITPIENAKSSSTSMSSTTAYGRHASIDLDESTDISETRTKRKHYPIVEVSVSSFHD